MIADKDVKTKIFVIIYNALTNCLENKRLIVIRSYINCCYTLLHLCSVLTNCFENIRHTVS